MCLYSRVGRRSRSLAALLSLGLLLGVVAPLAHSQGARAAVSLRVSPAVLELEAEPGADGSQPVTIANEGDQAVEIAAAVEPYKGASGERSAVDWLSVEPATFRLEPGESREVKVEIEVPRGLASGGRYALVTFTTGAAATGGSGAAVAGKLGAAFLVTVKGKGDLVRQVGLERFAPFLEADGRVGFRALLRNHGNVHVRPTGAVVVARADGQPVASLELAEGGSLLPGNEVLLSGHGSLPLPDGTFQADAIVDYGAESPVGTTVEFAPRAALAVTGSAVCENLDRGPTVTLGLRNEGELGLQPLVRLDLRAMTGGQPAPQAAPSQPIVLWPGEELTVTAEIPERLLSGEYALAVRVDYAAPAADGATALPPVEHEVPFRIGGLGDGAAPLC